jgi:hypothetical protein
MYAKWRIFVYQVAPFADVRVREGLGHRDGAKRRAGAPYRWSGGTSDPMK